MLIHGRHGVQYCANKYNSTYSSTRQGSAKFGIVGSSDRPTLRVVSVTIKIARTKYVRTNVRLKLAGLVMTKGSELPMSQRYSSTTRSKQVLRRQIPQPPSHAPTETIETS